jgi:hypothetical protein
MKRVPLVPVLSIISFFIASVSAGADPIGIDPGIGIGLGEGSTETILTITPEIEFTKSIGNVDLYAYTSYNIGLDDQTTHDFYLEEEVGFNRTIEDSATLSLIFNNYNSFHIQPLYADSRLSSISGGLTPSIKYKNNHSFGALYSKLGFPITYVEQEIKPGDQQTKLSTTLSIGWVSNSGLTLELTPSVVFSPTTEIGYDQTELFISYEKDSFYIEMDFLYGGGAFSIIPEAEYSIKDIVLWVYCEFLSLGSKTDFVAIPTIGISYRF